jgi:hypothetical protein
MRLGQVFAEKPERAAGRKRAFGKERVRTCPSRGSSHSGSVFHGRTSLVPSDVDRLLALVCRELGAREAVVLDRDALGGGDDARELRVPLSEGRVLVVRFDSPPVEGAAKQRRLEMLASTFDPLSLASAEVPPRSRPPLARALQEELRALRTRAAAINALVIDANSPVIWGAAEPDGIGDEWPIAGESAAGGFESQPPKVANDVVALGVSVVPSRGAIETLRKLPLMAALRRGKHLRHVERDGRGPFLAHSFAGIYCLVLVYSAPFDELRAERAIAESLGRVEQLVLALPPLDPSPRAGAGVIAIRRPRRK